MSSFQNVLQSLMKENGIDAKSLAKNLGLYDASTVYKWLKGKKGLSYLTAIKIADFFHCSLEYLLGRSNDYSKTDFKQCPPFDVRFKQLLQETGKSQYKLMKDKAVSSGNLDSWLHQKLTPNIETIIRLADYFKVTIDNVVGRE